MTVKELSDKLYVYGRRQVSSFSQLFHFLSARGIFAKAYFGLLNRPSSDPNLLIIIARTLNLGSHRSNTIIRTSLTRAF